MFSTAHTLKTMSSARVTGKKLENNAAAINTTADTGVMTGTDNEPTEETAGGVAAKLFPRKFDGGPSKEWVKMTKLKDELTTGPDKMTPFGQRVRQDQDLRELLKAEESAKEVAFDSWFAENWNKADLPTRVLAQKLHPEFYARREQMMMDRAMLALKIKKIQLRGPRDEEDMQIVYGLQSGDIELPDGWDVIGFIPPTGPDGAKKAWGKEMLKQGTFWQTGAKHQANAATNRDIRGGGIGQGNVYGASNIGNTMLYGDGGTQNATKGIWSRLF